MNSVTEDKNKIPLIKQLKNQFSAIAEILKNNNINSNNETSSNLDNSNPSNSTIENLPFINLTNRTYKNCDSNLLSQFLIQTGFKNESGKMNIYKFEGKLQDLVNGLEIIESLDKY
jgi:hypothetical protein